MFQLVITSLKTLVVLVAATTASQGSARPLDIPVNTVQMPEAPALSLTTDTRLPTLKE